MVAALELAALGLHVVPLHTPRPGGCTCGRANCGRNTGKHPRLREWEKRASKDPAVIRGWWKRWPEANVGVKTGPASGVIVVDVDPERGGEETLRSFEVEKGPLPETWRSLTGGNGLHVWTKHPGGELHDRVLGPGLEVRANGGQVVAPGSLHRSGRVYRWEFGFDPRSTALGVPPPWLLEALAPNGKDWEGDGDDPPAVERVPVGILLRNALHRAERDGRNNAGFWLACQLRDNRYSPQEGYEAVTEYAGKVPRRVARDTGEIDEYTEREAVHALNQAYAREPREPWTKRDYGRLLPIGSRRKKPEAAPRTLAQVDEVFRRWLYLPDPGPLHAALSCAAANWMEGDPSWLMLVGPPSSGKTEILNAISALPDVHQAATITEAALLSGTAKKERDEAAKGGLLREIGAFGILVCKDFTSVLSMHNDPRSAMLAALREIYDGSWTRHVGVDGGRTLEWHGKLGVIAGCTSAIDSHHAVTALMGERFLYYRIPDSDPELQGLQALRNAGKENRMRAELAEAVAGLFAGLELPDEMPDLDDRELARLVAFASLAARARSAVERDGRTREIELIPQSEAPARIAQALRRLLAGALAVGVPTAEAWDVVRTSAFDCIPPLRRAVIEWLIKNPQGASTPDIAVALDYPSVTVRRALEDLTGHGVTDRQGFQNGVPTFWTLSAWATRTHRVAWGTFSEKSQSPHNGDTAS